MPREDTQFKKGEINNPAGRPKGSGLFSNFVKHALEELGEQDFMNWIKDADHPENKEKFYTGIASKTLPKAVELSGPEGEPLSIKWSVQPVKPMKPEEEKKDEKS